ncbi:MAG: hypothetical protein ACRCWR_11825 [Saezia sp.]
MANVKKIQLSFGGGEISPEMMGRIDDAKYQGGLERCRNFIVRPQGPVENRAGFEFVRAVKHSSQKVRLISFTFSTTQTMIIEMGAGYFRFHTQGATLLGVDGAPYEINNPFSQEDLFDVHYVQSADVLTLVHPNHPPMELRRLGATNWRLQTIQFYPAILPPNALWAASSGASANKYTYHYVVTSLDADGKQESQASKAVSVAGNVYETGAIITVAWERVQGASRYNVYKQQGGLYGYIGQTDGLSLVDDNIAPDLSQTPPVYDSVFQGFGIKAIPVINGGSGYYTNYTGGNIAGVSVVKEASKSWEGTSFTCFASDPTGSGATFEVIKKHKGQHEGGGELYQITGIKVLTSGKDYKNPVFKFYADGKELNEYFIPQVQASITPIVENRQSLSITDPSGRGAEIVPVIENGVIKAVSVLSSGYGYTNPKVVVNSASPGTGAVFGDPVLTGYEAPGAVSYFEQRRCFAGTKNSPQSIWMTKSGTESNMSYSLPTRDDDRISFKVAAREANTIRHIVPLTQLVLLTGSAEWQVSSVNSDAITPTTICVRPQSYVGASNVQPVIINNSLIYGAARGGHIRELAYNWQAGGLVTGDLSLRAVHLFDNHEITDMAYSKSPQPIVWFVSSNGCLLGLTYVPEQQIGAWHWHDTDGEFESCAVVAEGKEDVLYCIIKRHINGETVRYIERMRSRSIRHLDEAFFVDSGLTYEGVPTKLITGLEHLEGKTVNILADGAVHPPCVVLNGSIKLDHPAQKIHVGLPIYADIKTLPFSIQVDYALGQGRFKNVNHIWLRVLESSGIFVGFDENHLVEAKQRTNEPYGTPPLLKTKEIQVSVTPQWNDAGHVLVRQIDPLPLTITNLTLEVALGG